MRVSVFTVIPGQEPLRESAAAARAGRVPSMSLESANMPGGLQVDPTFAAVPIGSGDANSGLLMAAMTPETSDNFVVRAFVEANDPQSVPAEVDGRALFADPVIAPYITCGGTLPVGGVPQVQTGLNLAAMHGRGLDGTGVAVAIMDTGINLKHLQQKLGYMPRLDAAHSWSPAGVTNAPGAHPVHHGTMCAFDALIGAPKATLLDFPILRSSAPGGSTSGSTLSTAVQAYAQLIAFWGVAFAPGGTYAALVVNNSWGIFHPSWDFPASHPGRYIDNPNHPFNALVSVLARTGADILFAAGNCGAQCPDIRCQGRTTGAIMGANASLDVLTLAGCDTGNLRVGYSSQGPSIANMPPQKPDVTAYTHFLGSEAFGVGSPDSGTSAACPVAAGCVAAIRTKVSPYTTPPASLFAQLRATANPVGPAGWNGDYGHGIINPDSCALTLGV